jgi:pyridinium-3,5-bisthiocarboxylic acid mononucleotide nickel chelatase
MNAILLDPRTGGMAGDMLCAALADLTGSAEPLHALADAIAALPCCSVFKISLEHVEKPFSAAFLSITFEEEQGQSDGDIAHEMDEVIDTTGLSPPAAAMAHAILGDLVSVKNRLHPQAAPGHAIASVDTLFDILGPLALLEDAGLFGCPVYTTPPALGGGMIHTMNGDTGGPAPAALEICARHRLPVSESSLAMELTTPTGAALLANLAGVVTRFPAMTPLRIGYGAGSVNNGCGSNILRVVEGEIGDLTEEQIVVLETNLDDVDGEVIGFTRERLFAAGAVDVFITPASGKKNRPVHVVTVITTREHYPALIRILMDETGTLGVRVREEPRLVADRKNETIRVMVNGQSFTIRVKTSRAGDRVIAVKPEYEDMKKIALALGLPLRRVAREVYRQLPCIP